MTISANATIWGFIWVFFPTPQCAFEFSGGWSVQTKTLSVSRQEQGMRNFRAEKKTLTGACFRHGLQLSPKMVVMGNRANHTIRNMPYKNWIWIQSLSACTSYTLLQIDVSVFFLLTTGVGEFPLFLVVRLISLGNVKKTGRCFIYESWAASNYAENVSFL